MAQPAQSAAAVPDTWLGRHRRLLLVGGPAVVAVIGIAFYLTGGRYAETDDAYLQAARVQISCNVSGRVVAVNVHDNQVVHTGEVLFQIDPRPFQIAIQDAEAQLAGSRLRMTALEASYHQRQADERAAQNTIAYRQDDFDRKKKLSADGITSRARDSSRRVSRPPARWRNWAATPPHPSIAGRPCARRRQRSTGRS
jgi:membrane fusion protein (multidrug efflux system)